MVGAASMRDLDKERALLQKEGLAGTGNNDEALAAADRLGGTAAAVTARLTTIRPEAARSPIDGDPAHAATSAADDAVAELLRLGQEAAAHAEKLTKRVDPIAGKPDYPWRRNKLQLARNAAADMVERLLAFLDYVAGDPDVEDDDPGGCDPCDTVGPGSEGDDQEIHGEADLASTECIDQRHIGQGGGPRGGRDGEMNLASLERRPALRLDSRRARPRRRPSSASAACANATKATSSSWSDGGGDPVPARLPGGLGVRLVRVAGTKRAERA
jgi:hypothetical protein